LVDELKLAQEKLVTRIEYAPVVGQTHTRDALLPAHIGPLSSFDATKTALKGFVPE
jgi:hypothetical protein